MQNIHKLGQKRRGGVNIENLSAEEVLKWAFNKFGEKIAFANSFGAEDVVLTDIISKIKPNAKIFTLDTGRLPQETYEVWERLEEKYKIKITPYFPDKNEVEDIVKKYGPNLFYKSLELRKLCCNVRKMNPLKRAMAGLDAWICGLRREQSVTRADVKQVEEGEIIKINPLVDWTGKQVWDYIKKNDVPYNKLHDKNYPSVGCAPCTRAVKSGEDVRAGRWWWETPEQKECGLHKK